MGNVIHGNADTVRGATFTTCTFLTLVSLPLYPGSGKSVFRLIVEEICVSLDR